MVAMPIVIPIHRTAATDFDKVVENISMCKI